MSKYKGLIIGLIAGLVLGGTLSAGAWAKWQMAKPIVGIQCSDPYYADSNGDYTDAYGKKTNYAVTDPKGTNGNCAGVIWVFDDSGNKCYVAKGSNSSGISCVKESK